MRFGHKPMLFFGVPGAVTILLGVGVGIYALIERFIFLRGNRAFLYLVILLVIAGLALFMLGFLGEMVAGGREGGRVLGRGGAPPREAGGAGPEAPAAAGPPP